MTGPKPAHTAAKIAIVPLAAALAAGCAKKLPEAAAPVAAPAVPRGHGDKTAPRAAAENEAAAARETAPGPATAPIYFDFDSYQLHRDAREGLNDVAKAIERERGARLTIEGHCDERGTADYNLALGQHRAEAARRHLSRLGVETGRMQTVSYGKERPAEWGSHETAWSRNRRAEFRLHAPASSQ